MKKFLVKGREEAPDLGTNPPPFYTVVCVFDLRDSEPPAAARRAARSRKEVERSRSALFF